jgi:hypothetical protein
MREKYAKFLLDFAPKINSSSERIYIDEFILNEGEKIKLPHYGGPLGIAEHIYTSEFELVEANSNKVMYICLKGADYIATAYANDKCVGQHEGFFAPF